MKKIIVFITFLYFALPVYAQHCEWDNSALIAVRPMYNGKIAEGLKIELVSTDNPYSTKEETHLNGLYTIYKDNTNPFAKRKYIDRLNNLPYFDFIKNDHVVITSNRFKEGLFIKITEFGGSEYSRNFVYQMIPVTKENLMHLCGIREGYSKFDSMYNPIVIELSSSMMMNKYEHRLPVKTIKCKTFYTPPVLFKNDSVLFQMIQTGIITSNNHETVDHEFFKIHPYQFALQHFDSLKNILVDENGWVVAAMPNENKTYTNSPVSGKNEIHTVDNLSMDNLPKKVAEVYDKVPSLKAFIAYKLANGNSGMEKYYLTNNIEHFNSEYLYEYLNTYKNIDSAKLEFDLDFDRDMDYCQVYRYPKPHINFYVFDNVLRKFVEDTIMSKAPVLSLYLKENRLIITELTTHEMTTTKNIHTYIRWNNRWQLIEWQLHDYQNPYDNINQATRRKLNDTMCTYDPGTKQYIQYADYNFDGYVDSRMAHDSNVIFSYTSYYTKNFDYFIYDKETGKATKDEFLSSGTFTFDFENKTAVGYIEKRTLTKERIWHSVSDKYEWIDNKFVKTQIVEQIQACPNCEKTNTIISKLIDGKWQQVDYIHGAE